MVLTGAYRPALQHNRLAFNDDMFLRIERVLGTPMVNQIVWRFDRPLEQLDLPGFRDRLAGGPLSRLVVRSQLPAARDKWIPAPASDRQLRFGPVLPVERFRSWIDQTGATRVDPEIGPPWVLEAVPLSDGGSAVALLTSHVVCDGTVLLPAIDAAARGEALPCLPDDAEPYPGLRRDTSDAIEQIRSAGAGLRQAWVSRKAAADTREEKAVSPAPSHHNRKVTAADRVSDIPVGAPTALIEIAAELWDDKAQILGGTRNSLLIAFTASLWAAARVIPEGSTVHVAMPVTTRTEADRRANTTVGVQVPVPLTSDRYTDLGPVRTASREAFRRRAMGVGVNPLEPLKPLMQMLPDLVVEKMAAAVGDAGATCSNVDALPEGLRGLGGPPARTIVLRTVTQNLTPSRAKRLGPGLTVWLWAPGDVISLAVQSLDLERFADDAALRDLVGAELRRWDLPATIW